MGFEGAGSGMKFSQLDLDFRQSSSEFKVGRVGFEGLFELGQGLLVTTQEGQGAAQSVPGPLEKGLEVYGTKIMDQGLFPITFG